MPIRAQTLKNFAKSEFLGFKVAHWGPLERMGPIGAHGAHGDPRAEQIPRLFCLWRRNRQTPKRQLIGRSHMMITSSSYHQDDTMIPG